MALIDKETIRKEIERLDKHYIVREYDCGWNNALVAILDFLDTLPEQPVSEEKFRNLLDAMGDCGFSQDDILLLKSIWDEENAADKKAVKEIVKTVHKEVTQQVKEMVGEQPEAGLEEEVERFCEDMWNSLPNFNYSDGKAVITVVEKAARHFAEWQKAKMLTESSKKEVDEFMSKCDRDVLDELNRWRFTTACQEFIEQGIFDYGCAKHFAEWGAEHLKNKDI